MSVPYDYYRIFYYVAKYSSFTQAAAALHGSQPNITRTINLLEQELAAGCLSGATGCNPDPRGGAAVRPMSRSCRSRCRPLSMNWPAAGASTAARLPSAPARPPSTGCCCRCCGTSSAGIRGCGSRSPTTPPPRPLRPCGRAWWNWRWWAHSLRGDRRPLERAAAADLPRPVGGGARHTPIWPSRS